VDNVDGWAMATIYISLGSNINREQNTRAGLAALKQAKVRQ